MSISFAMGFSTNLRPPNPLYCIKSSLSPTVACRFSFSSLKAIRKASIFCWRCCLLLKPIFLYPDGYGSGEFGIEQVKLIPVCEIIGQFISSENRFTNREHFQGERSQLLICHIGVELIADHLENGIESGKMQALKKN